MSKAVARSIRPAYQSCPMAMWLLLVPLIAAGHGMTQELPVPDALVALQEHLEMPVSRNWQGVAQGFSRWSRTPGQERWELAEINLPPDRERLVYEDIRQLGFLHALKPAREYYEYGIIPGATCPGMLARINYLASLWREGVRFQRLVFLTGQRPLEPSADHFPTLIHSLQQTTESAHISGDAAPMHETEAARLLYLYANLPQSMRKLPADFIDTPRTWRHKHWVRPNTRDTIKTWLQTEPSPDAVLMVSTQPHAAYQHAVMRDELSDDFYLETVASAAGKRQSLAVILDAVAGWLRQFDPAQGLNPALSP